MRKSGVSMVKIEIKNLMKKTTMYLWKVSTKKSKGKNDRTE